MRERNKSINIRVTEEEKRKLRSMAKKSGLSLSTYLIKSGLNQQIKPAPSKHLKEAYEIICGMNNPQLNDVAELILKAYYGEGES